MKEQPPDYRAGYVAILGRPNVGKSTLLNALMGQKIAAVSPRPQTTRRRQLGILTLEKAQVIFVDTPGLHKPVHKLGEFMNEEARTALADADVLVFMVDANQAPADEDRLLAGLVNDLKPLPPLLLALNKIDLVASQNLPARQADYQALVPQAFPKAFSALTGYHASELLQEVIARLPAGQPFFGEDQITDFYEREIAGELVREAAMNFLRDEVPHCVTVRVDEYTERGEGGAYIAATLFVERESQKGIVIGQGGSMLKQIGASARKEIETMSGRKVFLELRVKVQKNWRNSPDALRLLGFHHKEED
jgi:GTP-binding protein Era